MSEDELILIDFLEVKSAIQKKHTTYKHSL